MKSEQQHTEELRQRYADLQQQLDRAAEDAGRTPGSVQLVAVTKTHPIEVVQAAIEAGMTQLGENYVQELRDKMQFFEEHPSTGKPQWHFIGHLQRNKVKYIARDVALIHSVDSAALAEEIGRQAALYNRTIDILLQVNTSGEQSKSGCAPGEIAELAERALAIPHVRVRGLMTIAAFSDNPEESRPMFRLLRTLRDEVQKQFPTADFSELSMGMTGDFTTAIQEGATFIRIGTALFGERPATQVNTAL